MEFNVTTILSLIALLFGGVMGAIIKVMWGRVFKSIDDQIKTVKREDIARLDSQQKEQDERISSLEKYNSGLEEYKKRIEDNMSTVKADISREVQLVTGHLDIIHKKIDQLSDKLDRVNSPRGNRR